MGEFTRLSEVEVTADSEGDLIGSYGRIYKLAGDTASDGSAIPDGWVEVIFSPFHRELFRESELAPFERR